MALIVKLKYIATIAVVIIILLVIGYIEIFQPKSKPIDPNDPLIGSWIWKQYIPQESYTNVFIYTFYQNGSFVEYHNNTNTLISSGNWANTNGLNYSITTVHEYDPNGIETSALGYSGGLMNGSKTSIFIYGYGNQYTPFFKE